MSNIDKQQIRSDIAIRKSMPGFSVSPDHSLARLKAIQETQRSFGLEVVEALLDELEAKDKLIAEQVELLATDLMKRIDQITGERHSVATLSSLRVSIVEACCAAMLNQEKSNG